jgi:hypothetical protein
VIMPGGPGRGRTGEAVRAPHYPPIP